MRAIKVKNLDDKNLGSNLLYPKIPGPGNG
jgi:hypothetical protein